MPTRGTRISLQLIRRPTRPVRHFTLGAIRSEIAKLPAARNPGGVTQQHARRRRPQSRRHRSRWHFRPSCVSSSRRGSVTKRSRSSRLSSARSRSAVGPAIVQSDPRRSRRPLSSPDRCSWRVSRARIVATSREACEMTPVVAATIGPSSWRFAVLAAGVAEGDPRSAGVGGERCRTSPVPGWSTSSAAAADRAPRDTGSRRRCWERRRPGGAWWAPPLISIKLIIFMLIRRRLGCSVSAIPDRSDREYHRTTPSP